jgi:hypothetical protein
MAEERILTEEEQQARRALRNARWIQRWNGSPDHEGYSIFTEAGDRVCYLGRGPSSEDVQLIIETHNAVVDCVDGLVRKAGEAVQEFANSLIPAR